MGLPKEILDSSCLLLFINTKHKNNNMKSWIDPASYFLKTHQESKFEDIPWNVLQHSAERLRIFPTMFDYISPNVWGDSLVCLRTLPRMFGHILQSIWGYSPDIWGHSLECLCNNPQKVLLHSLDYNIYPHSPHSVPRSCIPGFIRSLSDWKLFLSSVLVAPGLCSEHEASLDVNDIQSLTLVLSGNDSATTNKTLTGISGYKLPMSRTSREKHIEGIHKKRLIDPGVTLRHLQELLVHGRLLNLIDDTSTNERLTNCFTVERDSILDITYQELLYIADYCVILETDFMGEKVKDLGRPRLQCIELWNRRQYIKYFWNSLQEHLAEDYFYVAIMVGVSML